MFFSFFSFLMSSLVIIFYDLISLRFLASAMYAFCIFFSVVEIYCSEKKNNKVSNYLGKHISMFYAFACVLLYTIK